jgi:fluoroacetyl-CoA thioesterase
MKPVPPGTTGTTGTYSIVVAPEHLASNVKSATLPPVLSTPTMILMMENAAQAALEPLFEPGESAVGSLVNVRHLAATPVGHRVTATARLTQVNGRRILFEVRAVDGTEVIGEGTHERALIDMQKFCERLAKKT